MPNVRMTEGAFLDSLRTQFNVIRALILREVIFRWGRRNIGFLWLFAEPLALVLIMLLLRAYVRATSFGETHYGISLIAFVLTGYCLVMVWRNAASKGSDAVSASIALLHHRNVRTIDLYLSRIFLEFIGITTAFIGLLVGFALLEIIPWPKDVLRMVIAWLLMMWFALGYGLLIGTFMALSDVFSMLWRGVSLALFICSGVFFMVAWLPIAARDLILYVPTIHGSEMLRHGYYGDLVPTYENPWYLIGWNLILSLFGLLVIRSPRLVDLMEQS